MRTVQGFSAFGWGDRGRQPARQSKELTHCRFSLRRRSRAAIDKYSYNRICAGMKIRAGAMSDAAGIRRPAALVRRAAADQEKNNGDQLAGSRISFVRF